MFCFPNADHVLIPYWTVSFKLHLIHVRTCLYLRIKRDKASSSPLDLSVGKKKTYKLKRAIDCPTVILISESGKLLLVKSGIQEFFFVKSVFLGLGSWGLESGIPSLESRIQVFLALYFCLIGSIQHSFAASGNYKVQGSNTRQAFFYGAPNVFLLFRVVICI